MSAAVIGWQLFIFITIYISGEKRGWVAAFWVLWTIAQVYALPLSIIQFFTIYLGYKFAGPAENRSRNPIKPEHSLSTQPKTAETPTTELQNVQKIPSAEGMPGKINYADLVSGAEADLAMFSELNNKYEELLSRSPPPSSNGTVPVVEKNRQEQFNSAYVTKHNFKKISWFYLKPNGDISIDKIFSAIYNKDLSELLSEKEATQIYMQQQMLANNLQAVRVEKKHFSKEYAFSVTPPKYHKDKDCVFLQADFSNYLVPPAIKALGEEKVREFQEYCESHKKDFEGKPDDIFWARVGLRFNVHITPERVNYDNSGTENVEKMGIDDLRKNINETISNMLSILYAEPRREAVANLRYAPSIKIALSKVQDETSKKEIAEYFTLKFALANSLFELYKRQSGQDSCILPVSLLKACGLEPCKGCCG